MGDIAHIGLVDAHAEGHGGNEAKPFFLEKGILVGAAQFRGHARMVGQRPNTLATEPVGNILDLGAGKAIDDAAIALVAGQEIQQLLARLVALDDGIGNIGTVEAGGEDPRLFEPQTFDNVFARRGIGSSGEGDTRHAGIELDQMDELAIFRAEIMAPLAHAMGLVDGKERDLDARKHIGKAGGRHPFRRHIEQVEFAIAQLPAHLGGFLRRQRRIERSGRHARLFQRLDLVAHQRNQRRHHDTNARPTDGRDLEAHGLAGAGGKQHDRVAAADQVIDDIGLLAAKAAMAKDIAQHHERRGPFVAMGREQI